LDIWRGIPKNLQGVLSVTVRTDITLEPIIAAAHMKEVVGSDHEDTERRDIKERPQGG
jgi:hypothetical protein